MRDDVELKDAITHVQYEFDRLVGTAMYMSGYLNVQVGPTAKAGPVDQKWGEMFCMVLNDALLESFLVHARNLIDFFIGPSSKKKDDIVATDFFVNESLWTPRVDEEALKRLRTRIGKRNAHLTYRRLADKAAWNPREIVATQCDLRDQFNALGPVYMIARRVDSLDQKPLRSEAPEVLDRSADT